MRARKRHVRLFNWLRRGAFALMVLAAYAVFYVAIFVLVLPGCGLRDARLYDPLALFSSGEGDAAAAERRARPTVTAKFCGHATIALSRDGCTLITDPVLGSIMGGFFGRNPDAPKMEDLPRVDAILITHFHADHYSKWTLRHLNPKAVLIVPAGVPQATRGLPFRRVVELEPYESIDIGPFTITAVPALHPTFPVGGGPWDPVTTLGYIVESPDGPTIYVSGDTEYGPQFAEIARRFSIDVACVNVNTHLTGPEIPQTLADLGDPVLIPMHWGGYPMFDNRITQREIADLRDALVPRGKMLFLMPSESAALIQEGQ